MGKGSRLYPVTNGLMREFPGLRPGNHTIASPRSGLYNCIAWAVGNDGRWWWPDALDVYFWPPDLEREETATAFVGLFRRMGFEECHSSALEPAFEKIAIYVNANGRPTHAARQLRSGWWTSKLGKDHDIEHDNPAAVEGAHYGRVGAVMRRAIPTEQI